MENKLIKIKRLLSIHVKYFYYLLKCSGNEYEEAVSCIIFSRDRAMQLDALLRSIRKYSKSDFKIIVQYSCSDKHHASYEELVSRYKDVCFVKETTVRETLLKILFNFKTKYMFYLVDDQVFIRDFDINLLLSKMRRRNFASMRLGKTITNWGIKDKPLQPIYREDESFLYWRWLENKGNADWHYQFSVDGTIYRTVDILRCTLSIPFKAPNSYEANMNSVILFKGNNSGVSFQLPVVVNLIINASRQEKGYEECVAGEYSADDLLRLWEAGKRFDIEKIAAISYCSCHHIINDINTIIKNA